MPMLRLTAVLFAVPCILLSLPRAEAAVMLLRVGAGADCDYRTDSLPNALQSAINAVPTSISTGDAYVIRVARNGHYAGAKVEVNAKIMHGKQSDAIHEGKGLFNGLASPMKVGRYHSLVVNEGTCPDFLQITARTKEGEVMGLEYKDRPWVGVQFHPESILTEQGHAMLKNFLEGK